MLRVRRQTPGASFDDLVSEQENRSGDGHAECFSGLEIDHELEAGGSLNGLLRCIGAIEDLARQGPRLAKEPRQVGAVGEKAPRARELREKRNGRKPVFEAEVGEQLQIA